MVSAGTRAPARVNSAASQAEAEAERRSWRCISDAGLSGVVRRPRW
ncbi:hypothetical protein [Streptomyces aureus]